MGAVMGRAIGHQAAARLGARLLTKTNYSAIRIVEKFAFRGSTDVSGFGLLGHIAILCERESCSALINASAVPIDQAFLDPALHVGHDCMGTKNEEDFSDRWAIDDALDGIRRSICFGAETNGPLMLIVDEVVSGDVVGELRRVGFNDATVIGTIMKDRRPVLRIQSGRTTNL